MTSPPMARICFADAIPLLPVPNTKTFCLFILKSLCSLYPYVNVLYIPMFMFLLYFCAFLFALLCLHYFRISICAFLFAPFLLFCAFLQYYVISKASPVMKHAKIVIIVNIVTTCVSDQPNNSK